MAQKSALAARRKKLATQMKSGIAILRTAAEQHRNRDTHFPFRHDSYFYYLTGFTEPEAVLVIIAGKKPRSILFCRDKDADREVWDGFRHGPAGAAERWRIEDLAGRVEVSVDTIRFYQKRRLLDPPEREGRIAWYGPEHRERLERIKELHELARRNLRALRLANLRLTYGDGRLGLPAAAPGLLAQGQAGVVESAKDLHDDGEDDTKMT